MATPEAHISAASGVLIRCYCSGGSPRQAPCIIQELCIIQALCVISVSSALSPSCSRPRSDRPCTPSPEAGAPRIEWEVKNRFRLFRSEADFQRHVVATRNDGVLGAERRLARASDGRGWARDMVERLCVDRSGKLLEFCDRDGEREAYLSPRDHRIGVALGGTLPANGGCVWSFDDGDGAARQVNATCDEEVKVRLRSGRQTVASVDIILPDGTAQRLVSEIQARDVLIAGMGIRLPPAKAIPTGRCGCPTRASASSASTAASIIAPDAPASAATSPATSRSATTRGSAIGRGKARAG